VTAEIQIKMPGEQDADTVHTALLLDKQGIFVAFGKRALDAYFEDNHCGSYLLFERFKMGLQCSQCLVQILATALNSIFSVFSGIDKFLTKTLRLYPSRGPERNQQIPKNPSEY
jgi:hypothetical protein